MPHAALLHAAILLGSDTGRPRGSDSRYHRCLCRVLAGCLQRQQLRHNLFPNSSTYTFRFVDFSTGCPTWAKHSMPRNSCKIQPSGVPLQTGIPLRKPDIAEFLQEVSKKARHYHHTKTRGTGPEARDGAAALADNLESEDSWLFSEAPNCSPEVRAVFQTPALICAICV